MAIARKYRRYTTDQTVTFSVGSRWLYVVLRDNSINNTWNNLMFFANGTGSVQVRRNVTYEFAFTEVAFTASVAAGLNNTGQAEWPGSDIVVSNDDPSPPPPPPSSLPTENFASSGMVQRA